VAHTRQTFGRLDVLVRNAADPRGHDRVPVPDVDEAGWHRGVAIKLTSAFWRCQRIVPVLIRQRWGRISNLSSVFGTQGGANTAASCTANFGIQGFTQALALEVARHGITVNAVCPGTVDIARMDRLGRSESWQQTVASIPLGRPACDEEVAGLIAFRCRAAAADITRQSININGGLVMR
jgi:NAD(P)-dependent dehydrogenase (short-subunit alcohol dehydrogenase family)